jgi:hypothetical protein
MAGVWEIFKAPWASTLARDTTRSHTGLSQSLTSMEAK